VIAAISASKSAAEEDGPIVGAGATIGVEETKIGETVAVEEGGSEVTGAGVIVELVAGDTMTEGEVEATVVPFPVTFTV
jgi:hypothetical protein